MPAIAQQPENERVFEGGGNSVRYNKESDSPCCQAYIRHHSDARQ